MDTETTLKEIEESINEFNLLITLKTTLSTKKGSIHYHLKQGKLPGILELTYWPEQKRLWVEIHKNRSSEWSQNLIHPFSESLAKRFSGELVEMN